jgi:hypothetical protein
MSTKPGNFCANPACGKPTDDTYGGLCAQCDLELPEDAPLTNSRGLVIAGVFPNLKPVRRYAPVLWAIREPRSGASPHRRTPCEHCMELGRRCPIHPELVNRGRGQ